MDERFVKRLLSNMKCGKCNKHYEPGHINILGHQDNVWFLSVYCTNCQSQGLVAAMIGRGKAKEVITDLSAAELKTFSNQQTIASDDILEMHSFLKDFDGDFQQIFKNNEP